MLRLSAPSPSPACSNLAAARYLALLHATTRRQRCIANPVITGQSWKVAHADLSSENEYVNLVIISSTGQVVMEAGGFLNDLAQRLGSITDAIPAGALVLKITNDRSVETSRTNLSVIFTSMIHATERLLAW